MISKTTREVNENSIRNEISTAYKIPERIYKITVRTKSKMHPKIQDYDADEILPLMMLIRLKNRDKSKNRKLKVVYHFFFVFTQIIRSLAPAFAQS